MLAKSTHFLTGMTDPANPANPGTAEAPVSAPQLQALESCRNDLLLLHRALLVAERVRYEKARGRVANNSAFLQLVLMIDERTTDKKGPLGAAEAKALIDRARGLLRADVNGDAFQRLFYDAVQGFPELAVLARQVATRH